MFLQLLDLQLSKQETTMANPHIIEVCRKALTGFEKNDKTDLLNVLADDVVFEFSDSLPYGGTYNGKAEFQTFWKHVFQAYDYFNYDAHAILEADDYVIVPVIARAKTKLLHGERASVPVPRPEREDCLWTHLCRYRARARCA